jgi:hypothetical protein
MELLSDCKQESEKLANHLQKWSELQPSAPGENTPEAQAKIFILNIIPTLSNLVNYGFRI